MMNFSLMVHNVEHLLEEAKQFEIVCRQGNVSLCIIYQNDYELKLTALGHDRFWFEIINLWSTYEDDEYEYTVRGTCEDEDELIF